MGLDSRRAPNAWCSKRGALQAQRAEDWCSHTRILQAQRPNPASDGWHRWFLTLLGAQLERLFAIFPQRVKKARGVKPWVPPRIVFPRPGDPGKGHYRFNVPRPGVPKRGQCTPKFPTRLPIDWHRRLLILLSITPQIKWYCSGNPRPCFFSAPLRRLPWATFHNLARSSI